MPLHDWTGRPGWSGVHLLWITELLRWIKPRLPAGYRAFVAAAPVVEVGAAPEQPDVAVPERSGDKGCPPTKARGRKIAPEPDQEFRVRAIAPKKAVYVERLGVLAAAVELVSPRNKDRPESRVMYLSRYTSYLVGGANLLLVDIHRRPLRFSFADRINRQLGIRQPPLPNPWAVAYRVSDPMDTEFQDLAVWRRPLTVGAPLPLMALPINEDASIRVDLEQTYMRAAADAYLS